MNHIQDHEVKLLFFHKKGYEPTASGLEIEKKVYLFINYLHDYSLLNEHEAVNVHIWDDLMIWASYLGLTKVVREQFKFLYPQYVNESIYHDDAFIATTMLVNQTQRVTLLQVVAVADPQVAEVAVDPSGVAAAVQDNHEQQKGTECMPSIPFSILILSN